MDWLSRVFGRSPTSAEIAKNRLKVVLSYDRTNLTPEMLTTLQEDIVKAISRHLDIDREGMTFSTQRGERGDHLVADIPIRGVRPVSPLPALGATTSTPAPAPHQQPAKKKHKKR